MSGNLNVRQASVQSDYLLCGHMLPVISANNQLRSPPCSVLLDLQWCVYPIILRVHQRSHCEQFLVGEKNKPSAMLWELVQLSGGLQKRWTDFGAQCTRAQTSVHR